MIGNERIRCVYSEPFRSPGLTAFALRVRVEFSYSQGRVCNACVSAGRNV